MNRKAGVALMILLVPVLVASFLTGPVSGEDGKAIFLAQKCDMCHSVSTAGIESKNSKKDLVNVVVPPHDAAWVKQFLHKQADLDGKKHMKQFAGTDPELDALVSFLAAQKK